MDQENRKFCKSQGTVRKFHCESVNYGFCPKSRKIKSKCQVCMISQVKSKSDACSQEMYGFSSLLVLITPFIEYVLKVTIKTIFHHSKTVCKI